MSSCTLGLKMPNTLQGVLVTAHNLTAAHNYIPSAGT